MRSSILITSLICSYCWISDSQTVRVKPGEDVTMSCSNISSSPSQGDWFRVVNGTQSRCIGAMFGFGGNVSYCKGFGKEKFEISSNISTVFLKIKQVDLSDSGLYICGFYIKRNTVIATAATLKVHDSTSAAPNKNTDEPGKQTDTLTVILGVVAALLAIIICLLAVKILKLQTASSNNQQPERSQALNSEDLNYVSVKFKAKAKRSPRPAPETSPHVVYAATR
ncbi:uncharacterized protein LOC114480710 [Gouania willdenowi]|uniref:uncharacterized protein LOC114480710 n=1 Tax=Gouania willdenowi TaxID=441366 RepID=UPI0010543312|nr:uncharacterized protein LOC114480710 [Gouania willdenowi]